MRAALATVGARGVDSLPFSQSGTAEQAKALKASGVDFFVGYLGVLDAGRLAAVLGAGLAFMPVTLANAYVDGGADEVGQLRALGAPAGTTVWLDVEGLEAFHTEPMLLRQKINVWADAIIAAGYDPGLYVGTPQPLTSAELYSLRTVRYWRGQGSIRDRFSALAEPDCGWCMTQVWPQHMRAGVLVDVDVIGQDYRGRLPTWVVG